MIRQKSSSTSRRTLDRHRKSTTLHLNSSIAKMERRPSKRNGSPRGLARKGERRKVEGIRRGRTPQKDEEEGWMVVKREYRDCEKAAFICLLDSRVILQRHGVSLAASTVGCSRDAFVTNRVK
mmetsp:Transcript_33987/g.73700  ORF Transcript_33987/g.73700 Transcript_33987/m.73700 type:complete len:123 (-) Transcript_33987:76-444(-)